jgi:hypothetical protein
MLLSFRHNNFRNEYVQQSTIQFATITVELTWNEIARQLTYRKRGEGEEISDVGWGSAPSHIHLVAITMNPPHAKIAMKPWKEQMAWAKEEKGIWKPRVRQFYIITL